MSKHNYKYRREGYNIYLQLRCNVIYSRSRQINPLCIEIEVFNENHNFKSYYFLFNCFVLYYYRMKVYA